MRTHTHARTLPLSQWCAYMYPHGRARTHTHAHTHARARWMGRNGRRWQYVGPTPPTQRTAGYLSTHAVLAPGCWLPRTTAALSWFHASLRRARELHAPTPAEGATRWYSRCTQGTRGAHVDSRGARRVLARRASCRMHCVATSAQPGVRLSPWMVVLTEHGHRCPQLTCCVHTR